MVILGFLLLGIWIGAKLFPPKLKKINDRLQIVLICLLIFVLGVGLGLRPGFINEIGWMGLKALLLGVFPTALSVLGVYLLERFWLPRRK